MKDFLEISVVCFDDRECFSDVVNQGIDSRLEGFTKSNFCEKGHRLYLNFHVDEVSILLRRLTELAEDGCGTSEQWERDIILSHYGVEVV